MLIHLPREDGYGMIPRTKNGPPPHALLVTTDAEEVLVVAAVPVDGMMLT